MITNIQEEEESNHTQFICSIKNQLNDIIKNEPNTEESLLLID